MAVVFHKHVSWLDQATHQATTLSTSITTGSEEIYQRRVKGDQVLSSPGDVRPRSDIQFSARGQEGALIAM